MQVFATFAMTGLIWFVQVVHYPLFALVPDPQHATYSYRHGQRTTWVVAPLMLVELSTAVLMLKGNLRPDSIALAQAISGVFLVAVIWISTAALQVPSHNLLAKGYNAQAIHRLVQTNWIRTVAWTLRTVLLLWCAWPCARETTPVR